MLLKSVLVSGRIALFYCGILLNLLNSLISLKAPCRKRSLSLGNSLRSTQLLHTFRSHAATHHIRLSKQVSAFDRVWAHSAYDDQSDWRLKSFSLSRSTCSAGCSVRCWPAQSRGHVAWRSHRFSVDFFSDARAPTDDRTKAPLDVECLFERNRE